MRTALVTGGAGFIGSHLVDRLLTRGASVRVLDNLSTGALRNLQPAADYQSIGAAGAAATGSRLEIMIGDIRDEKLVRKAARNVDCVFHLAALPPGGVRLSGQTDVHAVNVQGTVTTLEAAKLEGVRRFVFASCASVYGSPPSLPLGEEMPLQPQSVFAASKLAGEIYCRAYHASRVVDTVCLRYFTVYGPRQNGGVSGISVPALIEALRQGRRPLLGGDGRSTEDFVYVDDAVEATLAAGGVAEAAGHAINVASGEMTSGLEVLDILKHLLRADAAPRFNRARPVEPRHAQGSTSLAREVLRFKRDVSLVDGLSRSVAFRLAEHRRDERIFAGAGSADEERADV
jgi:UDP-glucose 4-epimerase